jgi:hypothetical protein
MLQHHPWRKNVSGIAIAPLPLLWGVGKAVSIRREDRTADATVSRLVCTAESALMARSRSDDPSSWRFLALGGGVAIVVENYLWRRLRYDEVI